MTGKEFDFIYERALIDSDTATIKDVAHYCVSAATVALLARITEQQRTIECLNSIINDHGPTTENVTIVGQLERRIAELERQPVAHHPV